MQYEPLRIRLARIGTKRGHTGISMQSQRPKTRLIPIISSLRFTEIHLRSRRLCNFSFVLSDLILSGFVHIIYSVYERHYLLSEIRSLHTSRRVHHAHREVR